MSDPAESLKAHLPTDLYALIQPLLSQDMFDVSELRRQVSAYQSALVDAQKSRVWPDMDFELGDACGKACVELLDHVGNAPTPDQQRLLHVAIRYYVLAEDDEDDLESLVGFDDDAMVINACARALDHEAAVIPLVPR